MGFIVLLTDTIEHRMDRELRRQGLRLKNWHTLLFTFTRRLPCNVTRWFYGLYASQQPSSIKFIEKEVRHLVFNSQSFPLNPVCLRRDVTEGH